MTYFVYRNKKGKEIVLYFLNTNEFSCGKLQIPCLCKQHMHIKVFYVTRCSFLHNLEQRLIYRMYDGVEAETRIYQASFKII